MGAWRPSRCPGAVGQLVGKSLRVDWTSLALKHVISVHQIALQKQARRHPTHHTVKHLPDVGWSQNLDLPPSAARPALPRGEITWFPPPRSACSRPFLAVFIQILKKNGPRETAAATLPRLCRRAPGRLPQPLGTRGRPLTDFGQPPPASSRAAPGTPALSPATGHLLRGAVLGRFAAETAAASALGEV